MARDWLERISPQIHHMGHLTFKRGVINPLRVIYDHELFMFSSGDNKLVFGDVEYPCPQNSFIILPPGREHISYALSREIHIHWVHFDWTYHEDKVPSQTASYHPRRPHKRRIRRAPSYVPKEILHGAVRSRRAFEIHIRLCEEWSTGDGRRRVVARGLLLELLLELLAPPGGARDEAGRAMTLAERTRRHLTELAQAPFSAARPIKESLRELGASYYHQERVFKAHYGLSPSDYVSALRIEKIKSLLRDTDLPVGQIARRLGFEDAAYFSRFVSKHAGCSPRALRRKLL